MLPCLHFYGIINDANHVSGHCYHACTFPMTRLSRGYNIDPIICYFSTCCSCLCGFCDHGNVVFSVCTTYQLGLFLSVSVCTALTVHALCKLLLCIGRAGTIVF